MRRLVFDPPDAGEFKPAAYVCQFSPDGKRLAAVWTVFDPGNKFHAHLMVWNVATGKRLVSRRVPDNMPGVSCCFEPDGRTMAIPRVDGVALQDVLTGEERLAIPGEIGAPMAFSPDGQILAATIYKPRAAGRRGVSRGPGQMESVGLWELATGQQIGRVKTAPVAEIAFTPDSRLLATASPDALSLWDIATGKEVLRQPIERVNSRVYFSLVRSLAFAPEGRTLATGLIDSTIFTWNVADATRLPKSPHALEGKELERFWRNLASDASTAQAAVAALAASPGQAIALFNERLRPAIDPPAEQLRRLLADLDSPDFTTRDAADRALKQFGDLAEPALRRALEDKPALEVRRRIEAVLASFRLVSQPEALRRLRAVRVLEQIGSAEAEEILRKLADGSPAAREAAAARNARMRLGQGRQP